MSKKEKDTTKTLLLIGAGALAAYLLIPRVKEAVAGAIPEFPSIDLGKLFPEGGGIPITYPEIDIGGAISDALSGLLAGLGLPTGAGAEGGQPDIPIIPPTEPVSEKGWWESFKEETVKVTEFGEKVAITGLGIGAAYVGLRYLGPPAARATGRGVEWLASRLFKTKIAETAAKAAKAGEMGTEGLGPAAATKGFPLKYARPPWWARLFGIGGGRFMPAIAIAPVLGPGGTWREPLIKFPRLPYPTGAAPGWVQAISFYGPAQPLPQTPFEMSMGEPSGERIVELYTQHRAGGGGDEGGGGAHGGDRDGKVAVEARITGKFTIAPGGYGPFF